MIVAVDWLRRYWQSVVGVGKRVVAQLPPAAAAKAPRRAYPPAVVDVVFASVVEEGTKLRRVP